jgi:hypothetical protein
LAKKLTDHAIVREDLYGTTAEPTYGGVLSFMRRKYTRDMSGVDVAVLGVPRYGDHQPAGRTLRPPGHPRRVVDHGLGKAVRHGVRSVRPAGRRRRR